MAELECPEKGQHPFLDNLTPTVEACINHVTVPNLTA